MIMIIIKIMIIIIIIISGGALHPKSNVMRIYIERR